MKGYAYKDSSQLYVNTVSATEMGAKVNAIVLASYNNIVPTTDWGDDDIERAFINATGGEGKIVEVEIVTTSN